MNLLDCISLKTILNTQPNHVMNLYQDGTELELVSRILGHSTTETTRIYAAPSVDMMRKVMESGNLKSDEKPLWSDDEAEMARICGLR